MALCWLILLGRGVQKLVFGELRVSEQQHLKDKFWNFVFYKFIFIFGVINVQYIDEVLLWCSWFSLLGFLHLLSQLGKDRFEYVSKLNKNKNILMILFYFPVVFFANNANLESRKIAATFKLHFYSFWFYAAGVTSCRFLWRFQYVCFYVC